MLTNARHSPGDDRINGAVGAVLVLESDACASAAEPRPHVVDPEWRAVAIHLKRAVRATLRRPHTSSVTALFVVIIGILTFVSPAVGGVVVDGAAAAALTALITLIFLG